MIIVRFIVKTFGELDTILSDSAYLSQAFQMGAARMKVYGDEVYLVI